MIFDKYDLNSYLAPFWSGNTVVNETVTFIGEEDFAPLTYPPTQIISVRSYALDTEYLLGKDYIIENGGIKRLKASNCPYFATDEYYLKEPAEKAIPLAKDYSQKLFGEQRYFAFGEKDFMSRKQIAVSYVHDGVWTGYIPKSQPSRCKSFIDKLKKKQPVTALFYGDSITCGCNSSGTEFGGNTPPYAPNYPQMTVDYLTRKYGANINYVNTSRGGMNSAWGLENVEERAIRHNPDLAVIAFGMNDGINEPEAYKNTLSALVEKLHSACPDCLIIIVATSLPNQNTASKWQKTQVRQAGKLKRLIKEKDYLTLLNMSAVHANLLTKKRFCDMTGNNINHPNDFLARAYAQSLLKTLLGKDFKPL